MLHTQSKGKKRKCPENLKQRVDGLFQSIVRNRGNVCEEKREKSALPGTNHEMAKNKHPPPPFRNRDPTLRTRSLSLLCFARLSYTKSIEIDPENTMMQLLIKQWTATQLSCAVERVLHLKFR